MIEKIDEKKCNGCGICAEICPMDVLRLKPDIDIISHSGKKGAFRQYTAYIAYPLDCMTCYMCELKCPTGAIDVGYTPLEVPYIIS